MEDIKAAIVGILLCGHSETSVRGRRICDRGRLCRSYSGILPDGVNEALNWLEAFDVFTDPWGDWMFSAGVLEKRLLHLDHVHDPLLLKTASRLYSRLMRLYPCWIDLQRPSAPRTVPTGTPVPDIQVPSDNEDVRREQLLQFARNALKLNSSRSDISPEEFAEEMLRRERSMGGVHE